VRVSDKSKRKIEEKIRARRILGKTKEPRG
jgi:hypothetical protein